jgi:hypothetical protein
MSRSLSHPQQLLLPMTQNPQRKQYPAFHQQRHPRQ